MIDKTPSNKDEWTATYLQKKVLQTTVICWCHWCLIKSCQHTQRLSNIEKHVYEVYLVIGHGWRDEKMVVYFSEFIGSDDISVCI